MFNALKVHKRENTLFVALPVEVQKPIAGGCKCNYCLWNPEKTPMWDTLALSPDSQYTWTVHYPDLEVRS
jgi:hypothetical protein